MHVEPRPARSTRDPIEAAHHQQIAVTVDEHEPRPNERRVPAQAGVDRVRRHAKESGQGRTGDVERGHDSARHLENFVDHRFDDRLRLVAKHEIEDVDVRAGKPHRLPQTPQPLGGPVVPGFPGGRVLLAKRFLERTPFPGAHPLVMAPLLRTCAEALSLAAERRPVLPVGDPFGQVRCLPVPVMEKRGGIREVEGNQTLLVRVQHGSLPTGGSERLLCSYVRSGRVHRENRSGCVKGMRQNVYSVTLRRVRPWSVRSTLLRTDHCDRSALHLCRVEFDFRRDEPSFRPAY